MPTYTLNAVNIGSFPIGESDKILTVFSAERGIVRVVAKGARKPGAKIAGKADVLDVNKLLVATGKSLDIITQAESIESFPTLRQNLARMTYCLYYAELTGNFGQGLSEEYQAFFDYLVNSIREQTEATKNPTLLCLSFEFSLLNMLGLYPELAICVMCQTPLTDRNLSVFHYELGGIVCDSCFNKNNSMVSERSASYSSNSNRADLNWARTYITPMVWKQLVLAANNSHNSKTDSAHQNMKPALQAAQRLMRNYIEYRAGRKMKALDLIETIEA